jgi:transposase
VLREQISVLHRRLLAIVRDDDVCRRLMTVPGVGPVVTLTYRVTRRCASPLSEVEVCRGGLWIDTFPASIRRE